MRTGRAAGDGVELAYGFWPGEGPPIVALHGITASHANFAGIGERLAGRRPLYAPDLRGRGDSDKPDTGYGMVQHARDVAAAMTQLGVERAVIVGHSMGAFVAAALADTYPDRVSGLVLIDGGPPLAVPDGADPVSLLDVVLAPQMARLRTEFVSFDAYLEYWRAAGVFPAEAWNPWLEQYLRYDLGGAAPKLRPKASEAAIRADYLDTTNADVPRERLNRTKVPVLMLRAEEGFFPGQPPLYPDSALEGLSIKDFSQRRLPGSTHYTIALTDPYAGQVADSIVHWAHHCDR